MEREREFYFELKQTNLDFQAFVQECNKMSPYFDFTPTFEDYITKVRALKEKFPLLTNSTICPPTLMSIPSAPRSSLMGFDMSASETNSTNSLQLSVGSVISPLTSSTATIAPQVPVAFKIPDTKQDGEYDLSEPKLIRVELHDIRHTARCKLYEKASKTGDKEIVVRLLGNGNLYVQDMDQSNKFHLVFIEDANLRRVLLNEIVASTIPIKLLTKSVEMEFRKSEENGDSRLIIVKLMNNKEAKSLYDVLNSYTRVTWAQSV